MFFGFNFKRLNPGIKNTLEILFKKERNTHINIEVSWRAIRKKLMIALQVMMGSV